MSECDARVADVLCSLLAGRIIDPARAVDACRLADIGTMDLDEARLRLPMDINLWKTFMSRSVQRETSVPYSSIFDAPPIEVFIEAASRHFGIGPRRIVGPSRGVDLTKVRHVAIAAAHSAGHGFSALGRAFNRNHKTMMSACERVDQDPRLLHAAQLLRDDVTLTKKDADPPSVSQAIAEILPLTFNRKGQR